ncbi:MAG: rRNA maturation RNase YbeY [Planctomycetes bacterium]|nr:rRNA maturation RNase YbeY [Planctomycetota bacterium]
MQIDWRVRGRLLPQAEVRRILRAALNHGRREGIALTVVFLTDAALARMHERWLADPSPTDVITFDLSDEHSQAGELYISATRARRVAAERGVDARRELALYLVHGALHLCGHDDHQVRARARMRVAERTVLRALGYPDDTLPHP